jgi:hypothetical protein
LLIISQRSDLFSLRVHSMNIFFTRVLNLVLSYFLNCYAILGLVILDYRHQHRVSEQDKAPGQDTGTGHRNRTQREYSANQNVCLDNCLG